jgi:hypothetical protein
LNHQWYVGCERKRKGQLPRREVSEVVFRWLTRTRTFRALEKGGKFDPKVGHCLPLSGFVKIRQTHFWERWCTFLASVPTGPKGYSLIKLSSKQEWAEPALAHVGTKCFYTVTNMGHWPQMVLLLA